MTQITIYIHIQLYMLYADGRIRIKSVIDLNIVSYSFFESSRETINFYCQRVIFFNSKGLKIYNKTVYLFHSSIYFFQKF